MESNKSGFILIAVVSIVAIVALAVMTIGAQNKTVVQSLPEDMIGKAAGPSAADLTAMLARGEYLARDAQPKDPLGSMCSLSEPRGYQIVRQTSTNTFERYDCLGRKWYDWSIWDDADE